MVTSWNYIVYRLQTGDEEGQGHAQGPDIVIMSVGSLTRRPHIAFLGLYRLSNNVFRGHIQERAKESVDLRVFYCLNGHV